MPVYGACCYIFFDIPNIPQKLASAHCAAAMLDKVVQDAELEGCELQFFAVL